MIGLVSTPTPTLSRKARVGLRAGELRIARETADCAYAAEREQGPVPTAGLSKRKRSLDNSSEPTRALRACGALKGSEKRCTLLHRRTRMTAEFVARRTRPCASSPTRMSDVDTSRTEARRRTSVSRSDLNIDRQVQLDETRLQQRHRQVIV
jgi:hypothetical protein